MHKRDLEVEFELSQASIEAKECIARKLTAFLVPEEIKE